MLPIEAVKVSSELIRPLTRRFMPPSAIRFLRGLGVWLSQWSRAAQTRLPEPVVICINLLLAWMLIPLIVLAFIFLPALGKLIVGAVFAGAAARKMQRHRP